MAHATTLETALESLRDLQRQAVKHDDGALLVLAGPGSGKTQVLSTRIARLLHEAPNEHFRVLALTFTNRAADEMRDRIDRLAPDTEHRLSIGTFHAFSADVLRQDGQHLGVKTDFRIYSTDNERAEIASRAISQSADPAGLEPHRKRFLEAVDRAKTKLIPSEGITERFPNSAFGRQFEMFYASYDAALSETNGLDFSSIVFNAHTLFVRYPALARRYRSAYRFWCVDEFQDTNFAQYELLKAMAGQSFRNLFAVADDDQIIYQWNGADHGRLSQFRDEFDADLVQITTNFRCPPEVLACANKLISCNRLRSPDKKPLTAGRAPSGEASIIEVLPYATEEDEARGIAQHIADQQGSVPEGTAVLARFRYLLDPIAAALTELGINSQVVVRQEEFQSAAFRWLEDALRLAVQNNDERVFRAFVRMFNNIFDTSISPEEVIIRSQVDRDDLVAGWHSVVQEQIEIPAALALAKAAARHCCGALDHASFTSAAVGVFDRWLADGAVHDGKPESLSALRSDRAAWHVLSLEVGRAIGVPSDPEQFLRELDLRSKEAPVIPDSVALMTIHGAKGNEFKHVYLAALAEDVLPSYRSKKRGDDSPEFEEERRSCYVAVTRCKQTLTLSYAERYSGRKRTASRFLKEMGLPPVGSLGLTG